MGRGRFFCLPRNYCSGIDAPERGQVRVVCVMDFLMSWSWDLHENLCETARVEEDSDFRSKKSAFYGVARLACGKGKFLEVHCCGFTLFRWYLENTCAFHCWIAFMSESFTLCSLSRSSNHQTRFQILSESRNRNLIWTQIWNRYFKIRAILALVIQYFVPNKNV